MKRTLLVVALIVAIVAASVYGGYTFLSPSSPSPSTSPSPTPVSSPVVSPSPEPSESPSATSTPTSQNKTVVVTDVTGAQVIVELPVTRIVSLQSGFTEIIYALGSGGKVVGRDIYSTFPDPVLNLPIVYGASGLSMEKLTELQPDLIVADARINNDTRAEIESLLHVPVIIDNPSQTDRVKPIITYLGEILGKEDRAGALINFMDNITDLVKARVKDLKDNQKPLVYYEWVKAWYSCNNASLPHQMIIDAGGINLAANQTVTYPTLSAEYVAECNPDVIIRIITSQNHSASDFEAMRQELLNRTGLTGTKAVKQGAVYVMEGLLRTGIRHPIGLLTLAKWFHPALFTDINVDEMHEKLIQEFFGLKIEGTYAYPQIVTVTDVKGVTVNITLPVKRIVAITSGVTDIIYSLGAGDKIVGRDSYSTFPADILKVPVVAGSSASPNIELIAELKPDLVIADTMLSSDNRAKLETLLKVPVLVENPSDSNRVVPLVKYLGVILGKTQTAGKIVNFMNNITNLVKERLQNLTDANKPLVYYEWNKAWFSCNKNSLPHQMIIDAGGLNLAADQNTTYPTLSPEYVAERNPDIIVRMISSASHNITDFQDMRKELMNRPALSATKAVQNGKVYVLDSYFRTGTRNPLGLLTMAKWFHPELFADVDPTAIHRDMIKTFFGVDLEGTYAYP
ncbi:MAG: ABC transporter substrate-binding protein [Candidatus Bathyarchaeales archaeon]